MKLVKKLFIISIVLAFLIVMFNQNKDLSKYSFMSQVRSALGRVSFTNPIDTTKDILNDINNLNNSYTSVSGGSLWDMVSNILYNISNFFNVLFNYIKIPFAILKDIAIDILNCLQLVIYLFSV